METGQDGKRDADARKRDAAYLQEKGGSLGLLEPAGQKRGARRPHKYKKLMRGGLTAKTATTDQKQKESSRLPW